MGWSRFNQRPLTSLSSTFKYLYNSKGNFNLMKASSDEGVSIVKLSTYLDILLFDNKRKFNRNSFKKFKFKLVLKLL